MRKALCLMVMVFVAVALAQAQSQPQQPAKKPKQENPATKPGHPLDPNDVATLTGRPASNSQPGPTAAPKKGHSLDPADVETVSGRSANSGYNTRVTPYVYYDTSAGWRGYNNSMYGPGSVDGSGWFTPRLFGVAGGRPFVVLASNPGTRPSFFLFTNGTRRGSAFFLLP